MKSSLKLTVPVFPKAQINAMPKQLRRAYFQSTLQMPLPERVAATRKTKSYLYNVLYDEANYLSRAKTQSQIVAGRITNATKANQTSLKVAKPVLSFIRRFKSRIQKSYSLLFLAGGFISLRFWQNFSRENLQKKMAKKADKAIGDGVIAVLHCNEVQKEWIGWLERAFSSPKVDDALLFLLINGIQEKSFINCSIVYGLDLVNFAFQQRAVLNSTLGMVQ